MRTLAEVTGATGFEVLEHLEAETEVPELAGLQAQGDLIIVPAPGRSSDTGKRQIVPAAGVAVIEAVNGGHEHRLFASVPGTLTWAPRSGGQAADIGLAECTAPAFILHPGHGATGLAPGAYILRRQREQADEQRLVAD